MLPSMSVFVGAGLKEMYRPKVDWSSDHKKRLSMAALLLVNVKANLNWGSLFLCFFYAFFNFNKFWLGQFGIFLWNDN